MIMKKFWFMFVAILSMMSVWLSSCKDDEGLVIWEYYPLEVIMKITNVNGDNLISEEGSLYGKDFKMIFDGKDYPVDWKADPKSRTILADFYGLIYDPTESDNQLHNEPILKFGELSAGQKINYDMTFVMPDGTSHSISIIRKPTKKNNYKQIVTVDGKVVPEYNDKNPCIRLTFVVQ